MSATLSISDIYFLQEFAKLAANNAGAVDAQTFIADASSILRPVQHSRQRPPALDEDLESERSPVLIKYFAEEFEKLRGCKQAREAAPTLAKTMRPRAKSLTNCHARAEDVGDLRWQRPDTTYLLYTSEAYLALERQRK